MAGPFLALGDGAVGGDVGPDQGHIAVVVLALLVHQLKDTLRTGQGHDDGVDLVGHLRNGLIEGPGQQQEGQQAAGGQELALAGNDQNGTHNGQDGVLDIAQVVVHRAHHIGEGTGLEGVGPQVVVAFIEPLSGPFLVAENLHDPLAVDHFLHVAVDRTQGPLLTDEEPAGLARHHFRDEQNAHHGGDNDEGENPGIHQHGNENDQQRHHRGNALGQGLGDHLPEGVNIVGVAAHDVARRMAVEIPDGQGLHVGEQLVPDGFLGTLAHLHHEPLLQEAAQHSQQVQSRHHGQELHQGGKIRVGLGEHGSDIIIHHLAQRLAGSGGGHCRQDDAEHHGDQRHTVLLHVPQQPKEDFPGVFCFAAIAAHPYRRHYSSPPFV